MGLEIDSARSPGLDQPQIEHTRDPTRTGKLEDPSPVREGGDDDLHRGMKPRQLSE